MCLFVHMQTTQTTAAILMAKISSDVTTVADEYIYT